MCVQRGERVLLVDALSDNVRQQQHGILVGRAGLSAAVSHYVDSVMIWIESLLGNENIFPNDDQHDFPLNFVMIVKAIFKRLFRVYAHIEQVAELQLDAHFNTLFLHFVIFSEVLADSKCGAQSVRC